MEANSNSNNLNQMNQLVQSVSAALQPMTQNIGENFSRGVMKGIGKSLKHAVGLRSDSDKSVSPQDKEMIDLTQDSTLINDAPVIAATTTNVSSQTAYLAMFQPGKVTEVQTNTSSVQQAIKDAASKARLEVVHKQQRALQSMTGSPAYGMTVIENTSKNGILDVKNVERQHQKQKKENDFHMRRKMEEREKQQAQLAMQQQYAEKHIIGGYDHNAPFINRPTAEDDGDDRDSPNIHYESEAHDESDCWMGKDVLEGQKSSRMTLNASSTSTSSEENFQPIPQRTDVYNAPVVNNNVGNNSTTGDNFVLTNIGLDDTSKDVDLEGMTRRHTCGGNLQENKVSSTQQNTSTTQPLVEETKVGEGNRDGENIKNENTQSKGLSNLNGMPSSVRLNKTRRRQWGKLAEQFQVLVRKTDRRFEKYARTMMQQVDVSAERIASEEVDVGKTWKVVLFLIVLLGALVLLAKLLVQYRYRKYNLEAAKMSRLQIIALVLDLLTMFPSMRVLWSCAEWLVHRWFPHTALGSAFAGSMRSKKEENQFDRNLITALHGAAAALRAADTLNNAYQLDRHVFDSGFKLEGFATEAISNYKNIEDRKAIKYAEQINVSVQQVDTVFQKYKEQDRGNEQVERDIIYAANKMTGRTDHLVDRLGLSHLSFPSASLNAMVPGAEALQSVEVQDYMQFRAQCAEYFQRFGAILTCLYVAIELNTIDVITAVSVLINTEIEGLDQHIVQHAIIQMKKTENTVVSRPKFKFGSLSPQYACFFMDIYRAASRDLEKSKAQLAIDNKLIRASISQEDKFTLFFDKKHVQEANKVFNETSWFDLVKHIVNNIAVLILIFGTYWIIIKLVIKTLWWIHGGERASKLEGRENVLLKQSYRPVKKPYFVISSPDEYLLYSFEDNGVFSAREVNHYVTDKMLASGMWRLIRVKDSVVLDINVGEPPARLEGKDPHQAKMYAALARLRKVIGACSTHSPPPNVDQCARFKRNIEDLKKWDGWSNSDLADLNGLVEITYKMNKNRIDYDYQKTADEALALLDHRAESQNRAKLESNDQQVITAKPDAPVGNLLKRVPKEEVQRNINQILQHEKSDAEIIKKHIPNFSEQKIGDIEDEISRLEEEVSQDQIVEQVNNAVQPGKRVHLESKVLGAAPRFSCKRMNLGALRAFNREGRQTTLASNFSTGIVVNNHSQAYTVRDVFSEKDYKLNGKCEAIPGTEFSIWRTNWNEMGQIKASDCAEPKIGEMARLVIYDQNGVSSTVDGPIKSVPHMGAYGLQMDVHNWTEDGDCGGKYFNAAGKIIGLHFLGGTKMNHFLPLTKEVQDVIFNRLN
jgi:hypothetical protein